MVKGGEGVVGRDASLCPVRWGDRSDSSMSKREEASSVERVSDERFDSRTYFNLPWENLIFSAEDPLGCISFHPVLLAA